MSFNYISEKVIDKISKINGYGIFAKEYIKKDELIAIFGGHVLHYEEWIKLPVKVRDITLQIDDLLFIGPKNEKEISYSDYVNHSCNPTAGINGNVFLVAFRDIKKDDEITFDYAMNVTDKTNMKFSCNCGERNCRKEITASDWKIKELQLKYKGYFSYYVEKKI